MAARLERTSTPGVYARGSRWVAVYLEDGRQRRQSAATFRAAREIKVRADAEAAARWAGPTLHSYALEWVDHYAGRGAHDVINDRTRREYRRLLITYALAYFASEIVWATSTLTGCAGSSTGSVASTETMGVDYATAPYTTRCCHCVRACVMPRTSGSWTATWPTRSCCRVDGAGAPMSTTSGAS
jgi:hypothetical protein